MSASGSVSHDGMPFASCWWHLESVIIDSGVALTQSDYLQFRAYVQVDMPKSIRPEFPRARRILDRSIDPIYLDLG